MQFRNDINGLRAISVMAVVLYHFGVPGFSGGFIGVDVFFVISGYLMTSVILSKYRSAIFSLLDFYLSRARRIIPGLFVLCFTLLVLGWFYVLPVDYEIVAKGALSSVNFVSNVWYWQDSGYFDAASRDKWLLHTWSLSVEWQFYLLYPLILGVLLRFFRDMLAVRSLLLIACAASLSLAVVEMQSATASFYLLPTRAWELMAGGVVYTCRFNFPKSGIWRPALEGLGLLAIAASVYLFHPRMPWPGYMAIVPVAGCALVMLAERNASIWSSNPLSYLLGRCSYSIYLWHWPIVVGLAYFFIDRDPESILWGTIASVVLGIVFYGVAEEWLRNSILKLSRAWQGWAFLAMVGVVSCASAIVLLQHGFPGRVPPEVRVLTADTGLANSECSLFQYPIEEVPGCHLGKGSQAESVFLIGDSHALSLFGVVNEALERSGRGGRFYSAASCAPIFGMWIPLTRESDCIGFYSLVRSKSFGPAERTIIILAGRWSAYLYGHNEDDIRSVLGLEGIEDFESLPQDDKERIFAERVARGVCQFSSKGKVYVVASIPEMKNNIPMRAARDKMLGRFSADKYVLSRADYRQRNAVASSSLMQASKDCDATILNPSDYLCDAESCYGMRAGRPIYIDSNHLNEYGGRLLVPMFDSLF